MNNKHNILKQLYKVSAIDKAGKSKNGLLLKPLISVLIDKFGYSNTSLTLQKIKLNIILKIYLSLKPFTFEHKLSICFYLKI